MGARLRLMINQRQREARPLNILAVFAHPDDEGFGCGGTLAALVAGGHHVTLVCATNGDVGEISDPALATPETLGRVRQGELREAMDVTGIKDVRFLNYRDSGMVGWEDNNHPNSLFQAPESKVVEQVAEIIREIHPDIVITHDPTGGYGHPDHVTICARTRTAVEAVPGRGGAVAILCLLSAQFLPAHVEQDDGAGPPTTVLRR